MVITRLTDDDSAPSETPTVTLYTLLAPLSVGDSKSGAVAKLKTPDVEILKSAESVPETE